MEIQDFLNDDLFKLPKEQSKNLDYKQFVFNLLDNFLAKLDELKKLENFEFSTGRIITRQKHLTAKIKQALDNYYDGKPSKAYSSLIRGLNSNLKDFEEVLNIREFELHSNFYRIRIHKENFSLPINEFFHVPFQQRGKVKTQRFSIPGFPSLYLGTTIYDCWEELKRPNINDFQAVRFKNIKPIKVIDLSPPSKSNLPSKEYYRYLMIFPLVLASSVKVRNTDDTFKPEYIIPQLLLQWVREKRDIDGIAYQTTHVDLTNSISKGEFLNLVLPVKENKVRGICNDLKQKFEMTESTSIQLSQIALGDKYFHRSKENKLDKKITDIELINGTSYPYEYSSFYKL
jgi:hypothetical protein